MAQGKPSIKTDPELLRQIDTAIVAGDTPIEAVFRLRAKDPTQVVIPPEETERLVREVLTRVQQQSGISVNDCNIFRNMGSFVISAKPAFLRKLLAQPEIASAVANRQPGEALIPPKKKRPVS